MNGSPEYERRVSSSLSGRSQTNEGLRREEVLTPRSRQSSVGDELYVTHATSTATEMIGFRMVAYR